MIFRIVNRMSSLRIGMEFHIPYFFVSNRSTIHPRPQDGVFRRTFNEDMEKEENFSANIIALGQYDGNKI